MYYLELERRRKPTGFGSPRRPGCGAGCLLWLLLTLALTAALRACA